MNEFWTLVSGYDNDNVWIEPPLNTITESISSKTTMCGFCAVGSTSLRRHPRVSTGCHGFKILQKVDENLFATLVALCRMDAFV
jgi:hypothetical protein